MRQHSSANPHSTPAMAKYFQATPQWLQNFVFTFCLIGALTTGKWFWISRIAWAVLAILITVNIRYALFSIMFFTAFFKPSGFIPDLFFTVKHFHLAIALSLTVQFLMGNLHTTLANGIKHIKPMAPLYCILIIGLISNAVNHVPWKSYSMTMNFAFILFSWIYLLGLILPHEEALERGVFFFIFGVSFKITIALFNFLTHQSILEFSLPHNNHMGILCSFSIFYALTLMVTGRKKIIRFFSFVMLIITFLGMLFSCSRTAWLSFLLGYLLYSFIVFRNSKFPESGKCHKRLMLNTFLCVLIIGIGIGTNLSVFSRFYELGMLFDPGYWHYTLTDTQNFGFLGIFRLTQLYDMGNILRQSPFIGVGFTRQVVDFHSLYFTFLGATGVIGFLTLAWFIRNIIRSLLAEIEKCHSMPSMLIRVGSLCALVAWLSSAFMETLILQYAIWINSLIACALIQVKHSSAHSSSCES